LWHSLQVLSKSEVVTASNADWDGSL